MSKEEISLAVFVVPIIVIVENTTGTGSKRVCDLPSDPLTTELRDDMIIKRLRWATRSLVVGDEAPNAIAGIGPQTVSPLHRGPCELVLGWADNHVIPVEQSNDDTVADDNVARVEVAVQGLTHRVFAREAVEPLVELGIDEIRVQRQGRGVDRTRSRSIIGEGAMQPSEQASCLVTLGPVAVVASHP